MGRLYRTLAWFLRNFSPRMTTTWEEPFIDGPCVFVYNHEGAMGPIDLMAKFPLREKCHAWCNEGIMNRELCPAYVRQDYWWEPGCRLEPLYNAVLPNLAALILPPILQSAPTIPVYHDARAILTMRQSLQALKKGEYVAICPEQPSGFGEHYDWINTGWLSLCTYYQRMTGEGLRLYPMHIDTKGHRFEIAKPVVFDTERTLEEQQDEIAAKLIAGFRGKKVPKA